MTQTRSERIKEIRDVRECSMQEAKEIERHERLTKWISEAQTVEDLKKALLEMVSR